MGKTVSALFMVTVLSACVDGANSGNRVTRTDSAGLAIVENSGEDQPLNWTFEPVLSLGGADSGAESFFQLLEGGLALGSLGRVYVLDPGNRRVHIFDAEGSHVSTFGGEGEGPGEFQYPVSLVLGETGDVIVFDPLRRAMLTFGNDGVFSDEVRGPRSFQGGTARVFGDTLLFEHRTTNRETRVGDFHLTVATPRDTADLVSVPLNVTDLIYEDCGIRTSSPPVFADPPKWDSSDRVTVISEPPEYSLRVFRGGREMMRIRRDMMPEEATFDRAIDYLGEGAKWKIGAGEECTVAPETVLEKRGMASHIPVIADVAVSPEGWIWVRRMGLRRDDGPIDIFDDVGKYQGTLSSDTPWPAFLGQHQTILSLEQDELDLQHVVLHQIHQG